MILKSMRQYHISSNKEAEIKGILMDISFLYDKDLDEECYKAIRRAKKMAEKYGLFEPHLEVLNWEIKLAHKKVNYAPIDSLLDKKKKY